MEGGAPTHLKANPGRKHLSLAAKLDPATLPTGSERPWVSRSADGLLSSRYESDLSRHRPGVVVKVGPRVRQFKLGDEVYARPDDFRIGTFAELVPVKEETEHE